MILNSCTEHQSKRKNVDGPICQFSGSDQSEYMGILPNNKQDWYEFIRVLEKFSNSSSKNAYY